MAKQKKRLLASIIESRDRGRGPRAGKTVNSYGEGRCLHFYLGLKCFHLVILRPPSTSLKAPMWPFYSRIGSLSLVRKTSAVRPALVNEHRDDGDRVHVQGASTEMLVGWWG